MRSLPLVLGALAAVALTSSRADAALTAAEQDFLVGWGVPADWE